MALEDYTLQGIRDRIKEDFGLSADTAMDAIIDKKINDALGWVTRRKKNWPWQETLVNIDVPAAATGTGDFTQGSRSVANVASATPVARDILTADTSSTLPSTGLLVEAFAGGTATLFQQWLDDTEVGKSFRLVKGFFQLPDDFVGMKSVTFEGALDDPRVFKRNPTVLSRLKQEETIINIRQKVYAVVQDPLSGTSAEDQRRYLEIFPYLTQLGVLHVRYWRVPPKLVNDADIPIIPHSDRMLLFYAASWFFSVAQREAQDTVAYYRDLSITELEKAIEEYEFADDATEEQDNESLTFNFIPGPPEFPEFT